MGRTSEERFSPLTESNHKSTTLVITTPRSSEPAQHHKARPEQHKTITPVQNGRNTPPAACRRTSTKAKTRTG
eukprot:1158249-Amphidinium_carterae.1